MALTDDDVVNIIGDGLKFVASKIPKSVKYIGIGGFRGGFVGTFVSMYKGLEALAGRSSSMHWMWYLPMISLAGAALGYAAYRYEEYFFARLFKPQPAPDPLLRESAVGKARRLEANQRNYEEAVRQSQCTVM